MRGTAPLASLRLLADGAAEGAAGPELCPEELAGLHRGLRNFFGSALAKPAVVRPFLPVLLEMAAEQAEAARALLRTAAETAAPPEVAEDLARLIEFLDEVALDFRAQLWESDPGAPCQTIN